MTDFRPQFAAEAGLKIWSEISPWCLNWHLSVYEQVVVVVVVFVVPAAQTAPEASVAFAGAVVVADASLFFVVGDVALVLAVAAQEFEIALLDFVGLFAVLVAAQGP